MLARLLVVRFVWQADGLKLLQHDSPQVRVGHRSGLVRAMSCDCGKQRPVTHKACARNQRARQQNRACAVCAAPDANLLRSIAIDMQLHECLMIGNCGFSAASSRTRVPWNGTVDRDILQCSLQNVGDGATVPRPSSGLCSSSLA